jgi:glucose-6-phosphate 1-dehydrogenase
MSVTVRAVAPETAGQVPTAPAESCTVIIFGATGDLMRRKLIPALYGLRCFGGRNSRCEINNPRWAGVPFYVRTRRRLGRKMTEIRVHFRRTLQGPCAGTPGACAEPNLITLRIQPDEGIIITFAVKQPGSEMRSIPVEAEFSYAKSLSSDLPDAYATLLLDAMRGDGTLFTRRDEVEAAWRIITPIEEAWAGLPSPRFPNYAAGSDGPAAARALMRGRAQHAWCAIEPTARPRSPGT